MTPEPSNAVYLENDTTRQRATIVYEDGRFITHPQDPWMSTTVAGVVREYRITDAETIAKLQALQDGAAMTPAALKAKRLSFDMTQEQFGEALGITANSVARLEGGESDVEVNKARAVAVARLRLDSATFYTFAEVATRSFNGVYVLASRMPNAVLVQFFKRKGGMGEHFLVYPSALPGHVYTYDSRERKPSHRLPAELIDEIGKEVQRIQDSD